MGHCARRKTALHARIGIGEVDPPGHNGHGRARRRRAREDGLGCLHKKNTDERRGMVESWGVVGGTDHGAVSGSSEGLGPVERPLAQGALQLAPGAEALVPQGAARDVARHTCAVGVADVHPSADAGGLASLKKHGARRKGGTRDARGQAFPVRRGVAIGAELQPWPAYLLGAQLARPIRLGVALCAAGKAEPRAVKLLMVLKGEGGAWSAVRVIVARAEDPLLIESAVWLRALVTDAAVVVLE